MEFRQVVHFLEIVKTGGFHKAANSLRLSQPAISVSVRKLETDLGITLFDRESKAVRLTSEGRIFYQRATSLEKLIKDIELEVSELRGLERGELLLGLPSMLGTQFFPDLINKFRQQYPGLHISVLGGGGVRVVDMIEDDDVELGVIAGCKIPEFLDYMPLFREEMVACVAPGHPFSRAMSITLREFSSEQLFLLKEEYHQREVLEKLFKEEGISPNIVFETNHIPLLITVTSGGGGATTLLRFVVNASTGLVPVSFSPPLFVEAGIAWKKKSYLSSSARAFLDILKSSNFSDPNK